MWQALIKLVEKWACMHDMKLVSELYENWHTTKSMCVQNVVKLRKLNSNETIHNTRADRQAD